MLLATYAIATLSVEQTEERGFIARIRQYLTRVVCNPKNADPAALEAQVEELTRFAESRHQRKIDDCLIPALRRATREADGLLADLEALSRAGRHMLRAVRRGLRLAFLYGSAGMARLCERMELYCQILLERLEKEEVELLPIAKRVISSENWFEIGAKFLSHDAQYDEHKRLAPAPA